MYDAKHVRLHAHWTRVVQNVMYNWRKKCQVSGHSTLLMDLRSSRKGIMTSPWMGMTQKYDSLTASTI